MDQVLISAVVGSVQKVWAFEGATGKPGDERLSRRLVMLLCATFACGAISAPLSAAAAPCDLARFRVVIDVGHGEGFPGSTSARGVTEFEFNRKLAAVVEARLKSDGFGAVTELIGTGVGQADLYQRADKANALHAEAFISLHHDSVQASYLNPWKADDGGDHLFSDRFSGYSIFVSRRNRHKRESIDLAERVASQLQARGLTFTRHHAEHMRGENRAWIDRRDGIYAFDGLVVLKQTASPAILLENGLIVNRQEELELASPQRQNLVAAALSDALASFCKASAQ